MFHVVLPRTPGVQIKEIIPEFDDYGAKGDLGQDEEDGAAVE